MTFKNILLSLLGDGAVRRKICSIASACTSGEGTTATWGDITGDITNQSDLQAALATAGGDLQSVTDSGNTTSNALQITGMADLNLTLPSTAIFDQGSISGLYRLGASGVIGAVEITDTLVALTASSSSVNIRPETGSDSSVLVSGRIEADPGINANDCAVMSQLTTLGETSTTAYRGDRGKTAYDHSQIVDGTNPHATTFANIASLPTTIAGYGITNAIVSGGQIAGGSLSFGTNDNNTVSIRVNNATRATFTGTGNIIVTGSVFSTNNIITNTNSITPTHSLTIPSVGTGIAFYNTVDQTTNYERLSVTKSANVFNINTEAAGTGVVRNLSINGSIFNTSGITAAKFSVSSLNAAPASATDTGTTGEIRITAGFIYVCTATNVWVRTALTTW